METVNTKQLMDESHEMDNGLGAVAWATIEMLKRGGADAVKTQEVLDLMKSTFAKCSAVECNAVLMVLEMRLQHDKKGKLVWYEN